MPFEFNLDRDPADGLVPAGIHRFVVEKAVEGTGDKGPYVRLHLRVYVNGGVKHDSLVFATLSSAENARFKVNQFFDAVGAPKEGKASAPWFVGKTAWARFKQAVNRDGDLSTEVDRYLSVAAAENAVAKEAGADPMASRSKAGVAAEPTRKSGGRKADVAEMDNDSSPF